MRKIILIEAFENIAPGIIQILNRQFPHATIIHVGGRIFENSIEEVLLRERPSVVIVAGGMGPWKHPKYGSIGMNVIPFIKEHLPETLVIAYAISDERVYLGKKLGADISCHKADISKYFPEIHERFLKDDF